MLLFVPFLHVVGRAELHGMPVLLHLRACVRV
jgi:hypothetical protein